MQRRVLAAIGAIALCLPATAAVAATAPDSSSRFEEAPSGFASGKIDSAITPAAVGADGRVTVIIEMTGDPVAVVQAEKGRDLTSTERRSVRDKLKKAQDSITGTLTGKGAEIQAQMQSAYNGIQASVPLDELDAVAEMPGVVAVHSARTYELDNAVSVPYLGVPAVWEDNGYTGEGVKVAIIDTGIDYTHATFGGPGTVAAFEEAAASSTEAADPALFGPDAPRVKGGIDLVGDAYDADGAGDALVPVPDDNPLDCQGHGSHVAGTTGGSGVREDGTTYTGAYDTTTSDNAFRVGPGVAPEVDLYAVRVFGCDGSTDVVVPAIDWAVANGMDVINMSLGSSFGRGDDPDAVAASNAVGAGVVVVTSAGNSGHNPYVTGSPSTGAGVIGVSAIDSSESFPGATVSVGDVTIEAINANGVSVEGLGALDIVRLVDDPDTAENEALGCSSAAYAAAGVVEGGNQVAVADRGTCARVAKAIFGQQAGAAAVVMVNSDDTLPPYEGPIAANPDDGTPYEVTIPFLGVRLSDGPALVEGAAATFADAEISNPGFRGYASFSSSGPRSGDSAISPDVAAPGVSIASAAVGSGNGVAIMSGTSMAAPHVAGVAALAVQAHPSWSAAEVSSVIVSTADPDKVSGQSLTLGGVGLVDTAQVVSATVTATGDAFRTDNGRFTEAALSYGFEESTVGFGGVKTVTLHNHGKKSVTYAVTTEASDQSLDAAVKVNRKKVTVRPGGTAKVKVTVSASAQSVPSSLGADDQFAFSEVSGDVVLTAGGDTLRVPYLLVPRSNSKVTASGTLTVPKASKAKADANKDKKGNKGDKGDKGDKGKTPSNTLTLRNALGALDAAADVYTWGLQDKKDAPKAIQATGYDLRAAGVQSFDVDGERLVVFAVNTFDRWSNGASNEFDVVIDTDQDGTPDWIVFSYDSGALRTGTVDGTAEVFAFDLATGAIYPSGFLAQAPTDSSTVLLPVWAGDVGIDGAFDYTVESYSLTTDGTDAFADTATYDPSAPAVSNGQYVTVPKRGKATVEFDVDAAQVKTQNPLGAMIVVLDNKSGSDEALLVKVK